MATIPADWRILDGYGGNYAITPAGKIYRLTIIGSSRRLRKRPKRIKSLRHKQNNYAVVNLYDCGKHFYRYVHKLVADTFMPPAPSPGYVLHHKDEKIRNNDYRNLEWMTWAEHMIHHISPLTNDDVREIRRIRGLIPVKKVAALFGVGRTTIWGIQSGRTWKHVK